MRILLIKKVWVLLWVAQVAAIVYFVSDSSHYGIHNTDAFSYHVQWSKVAYSFNPFSEAIVIDPGHDIIRVPFSMPHFFLGITATVFSPFTTYLIWTCIGLLTTYFSLVFFAGALGFKNEHAHLAAFIHYTFFHVL